MDATEGDLWTPFNTVMNRNLVHNCKLEFNF
nr:MAG TPA: hypothetical protein [Caudoviricetes sp.]